MAFSNRLNELLENESQRHQFSGAVLIKHHVNELFKAAYGDANKSWGIKNETNTRFRIASVSKLFTAVAILQLIDSKKLSVDTCIVDCLDLENTTIPYTVTIGHLLTMTAGIADWFEESGDWAQDWAALCREYSIYQFRHNEDYLPLFINKPPNAPVGQQHQYNNASYILLGLAIAKLSGLSYFDYVRTHIFAKANMISSDFVALDGVDKNVAEGYVPITNAEEDVINWQKNIYSATPEAAADGGATSTVEDLARFAHALRSGQLLSAEMTSAMLTPKVLEDDEPFDGYIWKYGYGNQFLEDEAGTIVRWGHTGEEDGVSCRFYYYPQQNIDVIILANQSECAGNIGWEIHDLILETTP
ncbi:MAG: beta-lactamase family protein [Leptolyngbya sp. SIO1E4]|nr:beta-lactamase family protein [Leptolyngbya sp. SIO1E4]